MRPSLGPSFVAALSLLATAAHAQRVTPESAPATEAGLRALLAPIAAGDGDGRALALTMVPEAADCAALFDAESAAGACEALQEIRRRSDARVDRGDADHTAVSVRSATTEELRDRAPSAGGLPGGMTSIAGHLRPGLRWFAIEFVRPGQEAGMAFAAFVHVRGRWVWVPKPWRFLPR